MPSFSGVDEQARERLAAFLSPRGFKSRDGYGPDGTSFGNWRREFTNGSISVRMSRDRSDASVELVNNAVEPRTWLFLHELDEGCKHLSHADPRQQLDAIEKRWDVLERAVHSVTEPFIRELNERRKRTFLQRCIIWPDQVLAIESLLKKLGLEREIKQTPELATGRYLMQYRSPRVTVRISTDPGWITELVKTQPDPREWFRISHLASLLAGEETKIPYAGWCDYLRDHWPTIEHFFAEQ